MKKILVCIFAASVISTAAFSKNFFSQRYFEIKTGTELGLSNNLFALNDYMRKDLVIDLNKIADECPEQGLNICAVAAPSVAVNLNIKDFHLGFSSGIDMYSTTSVGKDLFDFLGYGNKIGETMDFKFQNDTDVFAYSQLALGLKFGKLGINVQPAVFLPVISIRGGGGKVTVLNDSDGNLSVGMDLNLNVYSIMEMKSEDDNVTFDFDKISDALLTGYGFDMGAGVSFDLTKSLVLGATCHFPIVPGFLNHKSTISGGFDYNMKLTDFEQSEKKTRDTEVKNEDAHLSINRPMKFGLYADKKILGGLFDAKGSAGIGIRRPFSEDAVFYPEYYLGFGLNLIDIFKIGVSTQYKDQIFIHQLGTTINVRLFQLDVGASTQASSFIKSMAFAGMGGYVYVTVGF